MRTKNRQKQKFGRWEVQEVVSGSPTKWLCKCDCGTTKLLNPSMVLRTNNPSRSCGCLKKELAGIRKFIHGFRNHVLYDRWTKIKGRCYNEKSPQYKDYGARGIYLCDEWLNDPEAFINWFYERYLFTDILLAAKYQIDRIDNNGPYAPWNVRLVPCFVNQRNRRPRESSPAWIRSKERQHFLKEVS